MRVQHLKCDHTKRHPKRGLPRWMREAVAKVKLEEVGALHTALAESACIEGDEPEDELKCS